MSLKYGDTTGALENRRKFLEPLGIDYRKLICADQVHGNNVVYATEKDLGKGALSYDTSIAATDAFITDRINVPVAIFTADCLSLFLYDPKTPVIGLVHAGWRGTKVNISGAAVKAMQGKFNTRPADLEVILGPAMRACCFQVKENLQDFSFAGLVKRESRLYFDIIAENKKQLFSTGVKEGNIRDCGKCTYCQNSEFYSFRKEADKSGRFISTIMLKARS
jgi:YfiH family protein